jgi:hypothetical protein
MTTSSQAPAFGCFIVLEAFWSEVLSTSTARPAVQKRGITRSGNDRRAPAESTYHGVHLEIEDSGRVDRHCLEDGPMIIYLAPSSLTTSSTASSFCVRPYSVVSPTAASAAFWECASSFRTRTLRENGQRGWWLMGPGKNANLLL